MISRFLLRPSLFVLTVPETFTQKEIANVQALWRDRVKDPSLLVVIRDPMRLTAIYPIWTTALAVALGVLIGRVL